MWSYVYHRILFNGSETWWLPKNRCTLRVVHFLHLSINFTKVDHCKSVHCLVRRPIYKYIYFKNDGLEVYQFKTEYIIHMTAWDTWNSQQKLTALNSVIIHSIVLINHLADTVGLEKYLSWWRLIVNENILPLQKGMDHSGLHGLISVNFLCICLLGSIQE